MDCPFCSKETKVLESRIIEHSVRRRRECLNCNKRFTTFEKPQISLTVIKKDGREEEFGLEKIRNSLTKACAKAEEQQINSMLAKVEQEIVVLQKDKISTAEIARLVMKELVKTDKIAYLRFASVYKNIEEPKLLKKELNAIIG